MGMAPDSLCFDESVIDKAEVLDRKSVVNQLLGAGYAKADLLRGLE
jgi:hypothetical protein